MFVIHDGKVEVMREGSDGKTSAAVLEKGDFFGEMAVLEGLPRTASVRALTDVKLVRVDGATFTQLLRSEPEIAVRIMRMLSRRLREADPLIGKHDENVLQESADETPSDDFATQPKLVHRETGTRFEIPPGEAVLVGRSDPITGIQPEVDLSPVDPERSCSRQHAKILRDGSRYLLVEDIGTTNGTFLNGEQLSTGIPEEIHSGDEVKFGTVILEFEN
jgi:signal-transduction protein with cAMP-binding, CBS, and nucleotidyltransferase domain